MLNKLADNTFKPLPLTSLRPSGWLLHQLQIQANGLAGHLDELWPDVAQSGWIGGNAEGWERGPYWLDGIVPLAFLLDDARLKTKVHGWIDTILTGQQENGWLGPVQDKMPVSRFRGFAYDPWPVSVALKALIQYQEATDDPRVIPALLRFFHCLQRQLEHTPLQTWARIRSAELLISLFWTYERTDEAWLLDLASTIQTQGYDWIAHFANFRYPDRQDTWQMETHVVNSSMAIKQPGLWYRLSHDERHRQAVAQTIDTLDRFHGQVTGVFSGDEVLAGKNPSQGTELCAVVEYLFSLEVLLTILGEPELADRWERIAFNALPATFSPDMWTHQYDQQVNQVICALAEDPIYATNGADANLFGLEPSFGCCTANMGQGWPKFAAHLWMRTQDEGLAALSYAPCRVTTSVSGHQVQVNVETNYPFTETVRITVAVEQPTAFPLLLRVPSWTENATVQIGEQHQALQPGSWHRIERTWSSEEALLLRLPMMLRTQTRYHNSITLERGPLVYALRIGEAWERLRGEPPHADWEVRPTSPWNYALQIDRAHPEHSCVVVTHQVGATPFSPEGAPISIQVKGKQIPSWTLEHQAAGPLPFSPVSSAYPSEELTLIPYGCTNLRVTEFPVLEGQT